MMRFNQSNKYITSSFIASLFLLITLFPSIVFTKDKTNEYNSTHKFLYSSRARNYLGALNISSTEVVSHPENYSHLNHHISNAMISKLMLCNAHRNSIDCQHAVNLADIVIENKLVDMSFGGLFAAPIVYGDLGYFLPETKVEMIRDLLYNALPEDPYKPWCDISYSNIYLMHTACLIIFGEATMNYGSKASIAQDAGYKFWWSWVKYTQAAGLHEFDSPTYTSVQMNALYIIALYAKDDNARKVATEVLDYLWISTAAAFFHNGQMQSGPHSRDYDFLFGKGLLTSQIYLTGISNDKEDAIYTCEWKDVHCESIVCPWDVGLSTADVINCIGSGQQAVFGYHAIADIHKNRKPYILPPNLSTLARNENKYIQKRWQEGNAGDYHLFVSSKYSLGVISDDYDTNIHKPYIPYPPNAQDKILALALANYGENTTQLNPLPVLSLSPDWRRNGVYGKQIWDSAGKPLHLRMRPTSAMGKLKNQHKKKTSSTFSPDASVAVLLLAIDPSLNDTAGAAPTYPNATHLAMNTILPWLDGYHMFVNGADITNSIPSSSSSPTTESFILKLEEFIEEKASKRGYLQKVSKAKEDVTLSLLGQEAAAVVRIFLADSCGKETPSSYHLLRGDAGDDGGLLFHSLRLETVLYDSVDDTEDVRTFCKEDGFLRVGMIIAGSNARHGKNGIKDLMALEKIISEARVEVSTLEGTQITSVDVTIEDLHFELARDLSDESEANMNAIQWRKVNGVDVQPPGDSKIYMNGESIAEFPVGI